MAATARDLALDYLVNMNGTPNSSDLEVKGVWARIVAVLILVIIIMIVRQ